MAATFLMGVVGDKLDWSFGRTTVMCGLLALGYLAITGKQLARWEWAALAVWGLVGVLISVGQR